VRQAIRPNQSNKHWEFHQSLSLSGSVGANFDEPATEAISENTQL
jgi:hypothetical protein